MSEMNCPDFPHYHCHHCDSVWEADLPESFANGYRHFRDIHPDVWNADEALRVEALEVAGVR